ncbi:MAG: divergent PAP2 family protein, partial [Candidatus Margulisiibacteriota bacterium]
MSLLIALFSNIPLVAGGLAFLISQTAKVIIYYFKDKEFNIMHFFESAGMPSTHSAMSCSMSLMIGMSEG